MKKPLTLMELLAHHEMYARGIAQREGFGVLQSRGIEGRPADPVRTARLIFRFALGTITYDGIDYHVQKETT